jgi:hypothetical protein
VPPEWPVYPQSSREDKRDEYAGIHSVYWAIYGRGDLLISRYALICHVDTLVVGCGNVRIFTGKCKTLLEDDRQERSGAINPT